MRVFLCACIWFCVIWLGYMDGDVPNSLIWPKCYVNIVGADWATFNLVAGGNFLRTLHICDVNIVELCVFCECASLVHVKQNTMWAQCMWFMLWPGQLYWIACAFECNGAHAKTLARQTHIHRWYVYLFLCCISRGKWQCI